MHVMSTKQEATIMPLARLGKQYNDVIEWKVGLIICSSQVTRFC